MLPELLSRLQVLPNFTDLLLVLILKSLGVLQNRINFLVHLLNLLDVLVIVTFDYFDYLPLLFVEGILHTINVMIRFGNQLFIHLDIYAFQHFHIVIKFIESISDQFIELGLGSTDLSRSTSTTTRFSSSFHHIILGLLKIGLHIFDLLFVALNYIVSIVISLSELFKAGCG